MPRLTPPRRTKAKAPPGAAIAARAPSAMKASVRFFFMVLTSLPLLLRHGGGRQGPHLRQVFAVHERESAALAEDDLLRVPARVLVLLDAVDLGVRVELVHARSEALFAERTLREEEEESTSLADVLR